MKTFTLNGKQYQFAEVDYNMLCDFEEQGVSLDDMRARYMTFIRAYLAECTHLTPDEVGNEINEAVIKHEDFDKLLGDVMEAIEGSAFFQAITGSTETATPEGTEAENPEEKSASKRKQNSK